MVKERRAQAVLGLALEILLQLVGVLEARPGRVLLGLPEQSSMQGQSLLSLLGQPASQPGPPALSESVHGVPLISWRTKESKLIYPRDTLREWKWLSPLFLSSTEKHALVKPHRALFDLRTDPGELSDTYRRNTWMGRSLLRRLSETHSEDLSQAPHEVPMDVNSDLRERLRALGYVE